MRDDKILVYFDYQINRIYHVFQKTKDNMSYIFYNELVDNVVYNNYSGLITFNVIVLIILESFLIVAFTFVNTS